MRQDAEIVRHYLDPARLKRQGIFSAQAVGAMVYENGSGVIDHANSLFALLVIQILLEHFKVAIEQT